MRLLLSIVCLGGILACAEEAIEKPDNLIPRERMAEILYDLAIINAANSTNPSLLQDNNVRAMPYIFDKYGIDSTQFMSSDIYYASRPADYESIYKVVEARLKVQKDSMEEERRKKSDSIRTEAEKRRLTESRKDTAL
jgi:hypothetical protein